MGNLGYLSQGDSDLIVNIERFCRLYRYASICVRDTDAPAKTGKPQFCTKLNTQAMLEAWPIGVALVVDDAVCFGNAKSAAGWKMNLKKIVRLSSGKGNRRPPTTAHLEFEQLEDRSLLDAATNAAFVTKAFGDLLHRPPDPTGSAAFNALLNQGSGNRVQVALTIESSPEFRDNLVQSFYTLFLHRAADPAGLSGFVGALGVSSTTEQVEAAIAGSTEYFATRGGSANDGFLDALYADLLGRAVDPTGRAAFDAALTGGATRTEVATAVLNSPEYRMDLVESFYIRFLHRGADAAGLSAFTHASLNGATDELIAATILSSAEYGPGNNAQLTGDDVQNLLQRAGGATASNDAIIAIVDRGGRLLGVRMESGVSSAIASDPVLKSFAVDGAISLARTGAFFGNDQAPLTSRTIQFISQSTITQREVMSNPDILDPNSVIRGPGFVAPIGIGSHFPPNVTSTPQVDLFDIEHTNRQNHFFARRFR